MAEQDQSVPEVDTSKSSPTFTPYVPDHRSIREFSLRAILMGTILSIIFGAANAYLSLRVGLVISASIPAAVMAIGIFRVIGGSTVLENNMVQTIGSSGEAVAAGVIFTIPALILWGIRPEVGRIFVISALGGCLGILFMIPLRRYLIVREHGRLPYPEGTACANVLIAGDRGGRQAGMVFSGLGIGALYEFLMSGLGLWNRTPRLDIPGFPGARIEGEITPPLLGIGYIIGPRISALMMAGGTISWLILIPLITAIGTQTPIPLFPATDLMANMEPHDIWHHYIRYIGAGSIAFGGIITLIRSLPAILGSLRTGIVKAIRGFEETGENRPRTDRDIPLTWILTGLLAVALLIWILPQVPANLLGASLIVLFAFFFATVSSRIVGLIGSSSNPTSVMTIATLLGTSLIFVSLGWTGEEHFIMALSVGAVVCVSAATAGDISQNLKTGYLVGATPIKQQYGKFIGALAAAAAMGWIVLSLDNAYQIGSELLPAPQATLISMVVRGVLTAELPWGLVLIGVFLAAALEILGVPSLPCAVGIYLPLSLSVPIMVGGLIRRLLERKGGEDEKAESDRGVLYSSGLIAGGALMGIVIAALVVYREGMLAESIWVGNAWMGNLGTVISLLIFLLLALTLVRVVGKGDRKEKMEIGGCA